MIVKSLKVLTLVLIFISFYSFFTYFNGLEFKQESPLSACWSISLSDPETGEVIRGVEDIALDPKTGEVFLSAYDRRKVRQEFEAGHLGSKGGIYYFPEAALEDQPTNLSPFKASAEFGANHPFLPHGMAYSRRINREKMIAVNRIYEPGAPQKLGARIEILNWNGTSLSEKETLYSDLICSPNDLAVYWNGFFVTNDRGVCTEEAGFFSETFNPTGGVYQYKNSEFKPFAEGLLFPNGVAVLKRGKGDFLAVALTRDEKILLYKISTGELVRVIEVPGAPDNLTVDARGDIYFTIFPNLLDYYFYISEMLWVEKTPTGVFRITAKSNWRTVDLLFHDDGEMISGATVAQRAGDFLVMGSAWDDNIAVCSGMDEFKNDKF